MKHLLLFLFIILPFSVFAGMFKGTVTLNNGTVKYGYIHVPKYYAGKLKFRENPNARLEKIMIDDVKEFTVFDRQNNAVSYVPVKTSEPGLFSSAYKTRSKKSWLQVVQKGSLNLLVLYYDVPAVNGAVGTNYTPGYGLYVQKQGDDFCSYVYLAPLNHYRTSRDYKDLKAALALVFTDCPDMAAAFKEEDFKTYCHKIITDLYERYCGK